ncbi:metabotropic glutamate receptor 2 [Trichonephila clavata]|uniref:Metabotropic glutamate receptor 2 n=1 Tax=Trichonephila clavata TaxID=2740835 RepID=A0A8X6KKU1_TRICU|nr:metabotropic glutamate receptor 2 [Trichonephila clavata]
MNVWMIQHLIFLSAVFLAVSYSNTCCNREYRDSNLDPFFETYRSYKYEKRHGSLNMNPLSLFRKRRVSSGFNFTWPIKRVSEIDGDVILGGLMMIHEREDRRICGPIMPQGGIQALECMLFTMDWVNNQKHFLPGIKLGAYILDDCDKDTYGLEQAVDFIKGKTELVFFVNGSISE